MGRNCARGEGESLRGSYGNQAGRRRVLHSLGRGLLPYDQPVRASVLSCHRLGQDLSRLLELYRRLRQPGPCRPCARFAKWGE
jgi:hypothetical protein